MSRHEHYREICAAATLGQATGAELAELHEHLRSCEECEQRYRDFVEIQASQYASRTDELQISAAEALGCIDSPLLRKRFLERAESEGIVFSNNEGRTSETLPQVQLLSTRRWPSPVMSVAAVLVFLGAVILGGHYVGRGHLVRPPVFVGQVQAETDADRQRLRTLEARIADLEASKERLTADLRAARSSAASLSIELGKVDESNAAGEAERAHLSAFLKERDAAIATLQRQLDEAQLATAAARADLEKARAATDENQTALVESRIRVQELTQQLADKSTALEREKELFAAGRDIRELMAARNLHIVDVFDTDPKGKTRPAFGRIFFTEGKSLIFYAYDLNDARVQDAGYHYRVWGKREGPNQRARSLGIFYSDDKVQKRWVFQYDDPKVLQELDSVFVTLEPPSGNHAQPKGEKLMYAYLRGQANHP